MRRILAGGNKQKAGKASLRVFAYELFWYKRYLRVVLHLRPVASIKSATLILSRSKQPLQVSVEQSVVVLSGDFLIDEREAVDGARVLVKLRSGAWWKPDEEVLLQVAVPLSGPGTDHIYKLVNDVSREFGATADSQDVLEIGSRRRKYTQPMLGYALRDRARSYRGLDIVAGPNVDVVGDAHCLSSIFGEKKFDFIYSQFVFEHLAMPWVVASEINAVLRTGGTALLISNHSIGLHDMPYDFWRFSDSAWKALFNESSGFEVIRCELGPPARILPLRHEERLMGTQDALGYLFSAVYIRKIRDVYLDWGVRSDAVLAQFGGEYPAELDGR